MQISDYAVHQLGELIAGDRAGWPYRRGVDLVEFFNRHGFREIYGEGFPTRRVYAQEHIAALNGKSALRRIFRDIMDPRLWDKGNNGFFDDALTEINNLLKYEGFEVVSDGMFFKVKETNGAVVEPEAILEHLDGLSAKAIEEQLSKCRDKIAAADYSGAITNARSLVETVCVQLEERFSKNPAPYDGDIVKLFNRVRKIMNLDPSRQDISDALKQVLSGLSNIVNGLATIRNKMSDAHVTSYRPDRHHAKLAVNAANTLVEFLIETANYQISKGHVTPNKTG
jgi:ribosomal protein L12E/L44/L45/RPP1/RPP2